MSCPICSSNLIMYKKWYTPGFCYYECTKCGYTRVLCNNTLHSIYKKKKYF